MRKQQKTRTALEIQPFFVNHLQGRDPEQYRLPRADALEGIQVTEECLSRTDFKYAEHSLLLN